MKTKSRGNGQGCAFRRGNTWTAQVVVGWRIPDDPTKPPIAVKRTKSGFASKRAALAYCPTLLAAKPATARPTLMQVYQAWEPWYSPRVGNSTMTCYRSAFQHFARLNSIYIGLITAGDLQDCMDECGNGKRTHQNMKCVARLLWAYAIDRQYIDRDVTEHLYIGKGETTQREPITEDELQRIRAAVGEIPGADYVVAMCYLGFRPGEFLRLRKTDLHSEGGTLYLVGGSKTEAGRDRIVPVPDAIRGIIADRMSVAGTDLLFPRAVTNRRGQFCGYDLMPHDWFNKKVFQPLMAALGIEGKVPYCTRHTYSDKLKKATGSEKAKAAVIGHTDYGFTQRKYQSVELNEIAEIGRSIR